MGGLLRWRGHARCVAVASGPGRCNGLPAASTLPLARRIKVVVLGLWLVLELKQLQPCDASDRRDRSPASRVFVLPLDAGCLPRRTAPPRSAAQPFHRAAAASRLIACLDHRPASCLQMLSLDAVSCPPPRNSSSFERRAPSCRFVTHAGNARSFSLCSLENTIMAATEAYAGSGSGTTV